MGKTMESFVVSYYCCIAVLLNSTFGSIFAAHLVHAVRLQVIAMVITNRAAELAAIKCC